MYETSPFFYGTGRRKKSVARVRVYAGTGKIIINDREIDDYFGLETLKLIVRQPLALTGTADKFDIVCRVNGGGVTGQAGAIRHGLSRALLQYDEELRPACSVCGGQMTFDTVQTDTGARIVTLPAVAILDEEEASEE